MQNRRRCRRLRQKKAAVAEAATAALTAAADGDAITKNNAEAAEATVASEAQETKDKDEEILALIQERKMTEKHDKERIREISKKKIKKCIREKRRRGKKKTEDLGRTQRNEEQIVCQISIKSEFSSRRSKTKKEETINTRKGIANVFAEFYENLYADEEGEKEKKEKETKSRIEDRKRMPDQFNPITEFTKSEIQDAIDRLKKGKAKDNSGVRAEQLKNCSDKTKEKIRKKSSTKSYDEKTSRRRELAQDSYPSHLQEGRHRRCK